MSSADACKNCGAPVTGRYCSACGQRTDVEIPSFLALVLDALEDLYDLDSRLWRSVLPLLLRPGRLTLEYIAGRRARYLPPARMYLVLTVLFFLAASLIGNPIHFELGNVAEDVELDLAVEGIETDTGSSCEMGDPADMPFGPEWSARIEQACLEIEADSGSSLTTAFIDNIPLMMFLFIPIVAAVMKLLYPFAGRRYVEHLVFLFHYHAFFFLIAILLLLGGRLEDAVPVLRLPLNVLETVGIIYVPIYLFLAMRAVYRQGRIATTFKYCLLLIGYVFFLTLTFALGLAYAALTL